MEYPPINLNPVKNEKGVSYILNQSELMDYFKKYPSHKFDLVIKEVEDPNGYILVPIKKKDYSDL